MYGDAQFDACLASIPESSRVQTIFTGGPYDSCLRVPLKDRSNDFVIGGAVFTDTELLARRRSVISSSVRSSAGPRRSVAHVHFGEHLFEALRLRCHPVLQPPNKFLDLDRALEYL